MIYRLSSFLLLLFPIILPAQIVYNICDYLPNGVGDTLVFQHISPNASDSIDVTWPSKHLFRGDSVTLRVESTGGRRLETIDNQAGWRIYMIGFPNRIEHFFNEALTILPPTVKHGETYQSAVEFSLINDGRKQGTGKQEYTIKVEGNDSSSTPFRNFGDCLVLNTLSIQTLPDGTKRGYQLKEWYARDVGLVKMAGEAFQLDSKNNRTRVFKTAGILIKGKVGEASYNWIQ
jgi:hypothetical protein